MWAELRAPTACRQAHTPPFGARSSHGRGGPEEAIWSPGPHSSGSHAYSPPKSQHVLTHAADNRWAHGACDVTRQRLNRRVVQDSRRRQLDAEGRIERIAQLHSACMHTWALWSKSGAASLRSLSKVSSKTTGLHHAWTVASWRIAQLLSGGDGRLGPIQMQENSVRRSGVCRSAGECALLTQRVEAGLHERLAGVHCGSAQHIAHRSLDGGPASIGVAGSLRMGVSCTQQASLQLSQQPGSSRCLPLTSEPSTAQTFIFH